MDDNELPKVSSEPVVKQWQSGIRPGLPYIAYRWLSSRLVTTLQSIVQGIEEPIFLVIIIMSI